jgi:hypothetical protein
MDDLEWLKSKLPPIEPIKLRCEPDFYGISHLIAQQSHRSKCPRSFAYWMHGWNPIEHITHPRELAIGGDVNTTILVATDHQATILRNFGFKEAVAVGLPFIYADFVQTERQPNSLLVMPNHSTDYTEYEVDQRKYISQIVELKPFFSKIVFSIHGSCVDKNYWIPELKRHNIPWIIGASTNDRNALIRMNSIFKTFEYITTNSIGSHIAYAAYSGCKISIYGDYVSLNARDYRNDPWYQRHPDILHKRIEFYKNENVKQLFSNLFVNPMQSTTHRDWGTQIIGARFRKPIQTITTLLGWSPRQQFLGYGRLALQILKEPGLAEYLKQKLYAQLHPSGIS